MVRPAVDASSVLQWETSAGFWTIVLRAVLRRQFDALEVMIDMIEKRRSDLTVPLLRPACEEFFWVSFLRRVSPRDREEIVFWKAQIETFNSLNAQYNDAGEAEMKRIGFPDGFLVGVRTGSDKGKQVLRAIGARLGWRLKRNQFTPSVRQIAKESNNEDLYLLIYHATSRTVHFSVSEMLRRAWGGREQIKVSSIHMDGYWAQFSLYWAIRIFFFTFVEVVEELEDRGADLPGFDDDAFDALMQRFVTMGMIPIITPEEMNFHLEDRSKAFQL